MRKIMAKKPVEDVHVAVGPEAVDQVIAAELPAKPEKKITFEQFVARNASIKKHHAAGLRAFVKNPDKLRTEKEWQRVLNNY
jgi:hypothetical protein